MELNLEQLEQNKLNRDLPLMNKYSYVQNRFSLDDGFRKETETKFPSNFVMNSWGNDCNIKSYFFSYEQIDAAISLLWKAIWFGVRKNLCSLIPLGTNLCRFPLRLIHKECESI